MITNTFHKNDNLIGINIEREGNSFIICVAYLLTNGKWTAKTLSGISGDKDDEDLIKKIITKGHCLDKKTANSIFSNVGQREIDYQDKD